MRKGAYHDEAFGGFVARRCCGLLERVAGPSPAVAGNSAGHRRGRGRGRAVLRTGTRVLPAGRGERRADEVPQRRRGCAGRIAGALDFGVTNSGSLALGHERGLPIALVACVALFTQASPLCHFVVGKRSGIRSAQDLSGRTVATSGLKDMLHISTLAWIDSKGGDSKSVNFVEIPFPQMAAAVLARRVDGATIVEPFYTRSRDELEQIGLNYVAVNDGRPFQTLGLVANTRWLSENGATAVKISEVVHAAARWANRNHDEAAKLLADFTQTDPSVVRAYPRVVFAERNSPEYVQPVIDMMARYGALRRRFAAADVFAAGLA